MHDQPITDVSLRPFAPWNRNKLVGPKRPLKPKHVWTIRSHLQLKNCTRDLAIFNLAIDSKLRGCDLMRLRVDDVAPHGDVLDRVTVRQRKTHRSVSFEMTEQTRESIKAHLGERDAEPGSYLFPSRRSKGQPLSTRHYCRLVKSWVSSVGLDSSFYGSHSLRRTKAALIYRRTGNLRAVQILLGHSKIESTVRYLGVEVDDALAIAEKVEI